MSEEKKTVHKEAYLLLFSTFFMFSTIHVTGKVVSPYMPAALVVGIRCLIALIPLGFMARKHFDVKVEKEDWKWFVIIGCLTYFVSPFMIQVAISLTGASMASLLNSMTPVAVTILAVVILREKLTPPKLLCLVLAIIGATIITKGANTESQFFGVAAAIASVISSATSSVLMRRLSSKYPAILITFYGTAISLICHVPMSIYSIATQPVTFNMTAIIVLVYLGIVGSGLAQFTWTKSLSLLPAVTCSLFYPLQPVFTTIMGALFLKENVTLPFLVGLFLISLDIVINILATSKEK